MNNFITKYEKILLRLKLFVTKAAFYIKFFETIEQFLNLELSRCPMFKSNIKCEPIKSIRIFLFLVQTLSKCLHPKEFLCCNKLSRILKAFSEVFVIDNYKSNSYRQNRYQREPHLPRICFQPPNR